MKFSIYYLGAFVFLASFAAIGESYMATAGNLKHGDDQSRHSQQTIRAAGQIDPERVAVRDHENMPRPQGSRYDVEKLLTSDMSLPTTSKSGYAVDLGIVLGDDSGLKCRTNTCKIKSSRNAKLVESAEIKPCQSLNELMQLPICKSEEDELYYSQNIFTAPMKIKCRPRLLGVYSNHDDNLEADLSCSPLETFLPNVQELLVDGGLKDATNFTKDSKTREGIIDRHPAQDAAAEDLSYNPTLVRSITVTQELIYEPVAAGDASKVVEARNPQIPDYGYHPNVEELNEGKLLLDAYNKSISKGTEIYANGANSGYTPPATDCDTNSAETKCDLGDSIKNSGWPGKTTNHTCMDKPNKDFTGPHPTSSESGFCQLWSNLTGDAVQTDPKHGQALQHQIEEEQNAKKQQQIHNQLDIKNGTWVSDASNPKSQKYWFEKYLQLVSLGMLVWFLIAAGELWYLFQI